MCIVATVRGHWGRSHDSQEQAVVRQAKFTDAFEKPGRVVGKRLSLLTCPDPVFRSHGDLNFGGALSGLASEARCRIQILYHILYQIGRAHV